MCLPPITTDLSRLRATWVNFDGAVAVMISRHIPRGNRTLLPSTSAPASPKSLTACSSVMSTPTLSRMVSAFSSMISRASVLRIS